MFRVRAAIAVGFAMALVASLLWYRESDSRAPDASASDMKVLNVVPFGVGFGPVPRVQKESRAQVVAKSKDGYFVVTTLEVVFLSVSTPDEFAKANVDVNSIDWDGMVGAVRTGIAKFTAEELKGDLDNARAVLSKVREAAEAAVTQKKYDTQLTVRNVSFINFSVTTLKEDGSSGKPTDTPPSDSKDKPAEEPKGKPAGDSGEQAANKPTEATMGKQK